MNCYNHRMALACMAGGMLFAAGCGYGQVSPMAYELSKALYSATNLQSMERLKTVEIAVEEAHQSGKLTAQEQQWFRTIIKDAQSGNWQAASQASRRMMEDQVVSRRNTPRK